MSYVPDYVARRIRQPRPPVGSIISFSTPVVAFGDFTKAKVATVGWNPSKKEFLNDEGRELDCKKQRLETMTSLGVDRLEDLDDSRVRQVFQGCNRYFERNPYRGWFDRLKIVFDSLGRSYYDGSVCHLDIVQWATDPVWRAVPRLDKKRLVTQDAEFFKTQVASRNIKLVLLNGTGILNAYQRTVGGPFDPVWTMEKGRKLQISRNRNDPRVFAWNINVQSTPGVTNQDKHEIGMQLKTLVADQLGD